MYRQRMNKRHWHRHASSLRRQRCGAALVEFAMVAPILFFLFAMFLEFGRYIVTVHALEEAARVGCRIAVLEDSTSQEVKDEVAGVLQLFGINRYDLSIAPSLFTACGPGDPVSVTLKVKYKDVSWLPTPHFLGNHQLSVTNTTPKEK